ncbi:hypothetical protein NA56DRAFT_697296 [Hyaloscypha hepaticicola]|uniref:Uncharacterized protein n=1 Tax=Hyaloscypha hepaticicola TaxID=2082293 RepID=A0A2J6QLL1_9HELO|nr:hypothetical protein NA56DRAFT_697296 [Hyaloscypha hepaticicola]
MTSLRTAPAVVARAWTALAWLPPCSTSSSFSLPLDPNSSCHAALFPGVKITVFLLDLSACHQANDVGIIASRGSLEDCDLYLDVEDVRTAQRQYHNKTSVYARQWNKQPDHNHVY